jgi:CRISPR/Cas system-associated exonuclease Cas4 (RecB family)
MTIPCSHSIISRSIIRYLSTTHREEIKMDIDLEDKVEETLEDVEDWWYVITINN